MALTHNIFTFGLVACCGLTACSDDGSNGPSLTGVKGDARDIYRTSGGESVVASEATRWSTIAARPLGAAPSASYPGTLSAEGDITIADVPEGPYLLELTASAAPESQPVATFYELSGRTFDAARVFSHRPDVQAMTQPSLLTLYASLTRPWQNDAIDAQGEPEISLGDELFFYSRNAYVVARVATGFDFAPSNDVPSNAPANGDASFAWTLNAKAAFSSYIGADGAHLLDAAKGDDVIVLHEVAKAVRTPGVPPAGGGRDPWLAYSYSSAEAALVAGPFTLTDGGAATIAGAFAPLPPKTFAFNYKGTAFNALLSDLPTSELSSYVFSFSLDHEPSSPEPAIGAFADLVSFDLLKSREFVDPVCNFSDPELCNDATACPSGCNAADVLVLPGDHTQQYVYGTPFEGGQEIASVRFSFTAIASEGLPEGETPERLRGDFFLRAPAAELTGKPIEPTMSLPRNVTLNGKPAPLTGVSTGVGLTPVIAFEPPAIGAPTYYAVRVIEANDRPTSEDMFPDRNRSIGYVQLAGTSITLPEGLLQAGKLYFLQVQAVAAEQQAQRIFRFGARYARATTFTGVFTP